MKRFISNLLTVCFICYMILLVYFLFFSEEYGRNEPYTTYQYNLELFREIKRYLMYREQIGMVYFAINLLGNVVVFMPFGFLVPVLYREQRKGVHFKGHYFRSGLFVTFLGFAFSLVVETIQLVTKVGCFDVDDLLLSFKKNHSCTRKKVKGDRIWKYVLEIGKEYVLVIRNIRNMELFRWYWVSFRLLFS